jgi:hypothetical protein
MLLDELKSGLLTSTEEQRQHWAGNIVRDNISIKELSVMLQLEPKIAIRFMWLLTDVALIDSEKLLVELPYILNLVNSLKLKNTEVTIANYWLICGVPEENEAQAIDSMFKWLNSPKYNVTTKSRSLLALYNLSKKYPELKIELKLCLEDQMGKNSESFDKRAEKILVELQ